MESTKKHSERCSHSETWTPFGLRNIPFNISHISVFTKQHNQQTGLYIISGVSTCNVNRA